MIKVLVDTDILTYYLFKDYPQVKQNFENYLSEFGFIHIGRPTIFEIESGLLAKKAYKHFGIFQEFIQKQTILEITELSAHISAKNYAYLVSIGKHSGTNDLYLAGNYIVKIKLLHNKLQVKCTCPHFDDGYICKHISAVMLKTAKNVDKIFKNNFTIEDNNIPIIEPYYSEQLLQKFSKEELIEIILKLTKI